MGFVTAFGGGVVYIRAEEAGIPADEAVAVVPRESLIAIGATFLLPAVGIALASVLLVFLVVAIVEWRQKRALGLTDKARKDLLDNAAKAEDGAILAQGKATSSSTKLEGAQRSLASANALSQETTEMIKEDANEHAKQATTATAEAAELSQQAGVARKKVAAVDKRVDRQVQLQRSARLFIATGLLLLVELLVLVLYVRGAEEFVQWLVVLVVAGIAAGISGAVYARSDSFVRFAAAAFVSIGVVIGIADYDRLRNSPRMEPAAALRKDGISLTGYFVAATDSRIYLGRAGDDARIVEIPRDNLAILTVGPLMDAEGAQGRAALLATELCEDYKAAKRNSATASTSTTTQTSSSTRGRKGQKSTRTKEKAARCTVR